MIKEYKQRFLKIWRASDKSARKIGRMWYTRAYSEAKRLASEYHYPIPDVVSAIAALSPLVSWERNLELAEMLCDGVEPDDMPCIKRNARIAHNHLTGKADKELNGPKTRAFAAAIMGDFDSAVIDRHMMRAAEFHKEACNDNDYYELATALRLAANEVQVPVTHFQATIWIMIREPQLTFDL